MSLNQTAFNRDQLSRYNLSTSSDHELLSFATNFRSHKIVKAPEDLLHELHAQIYKLERILVRLNNRRLNQSGISTELQSRFYKECVENLISSISHYDLNTVSVQLEMFFNEMGYSTEELNSNLQLKFYSDYLCQILKSISSNIAQRKNIEIPEAIDSFARAHANSYEL